MTTHDKNGVTVRIPTVLRRFTDGKSRVDVGGRTVKEAITALTGFYPSLVTHLFDADGQLRSFVNLYVNDQDTRYLNGTATVLHHGDVLSVVPAVAGG